MPLGFIFVFLKRFFDFFKKNSLIFGTFWLQALLEGRVFEVPVFDNVRLFKITIFGLWEMAIIKKNLSFFSFTMFFGN